MNMFERTHAFAPDRFIRHYTVNYYFLLMQKTQKQCRNWKRHDLNRCHCMSREHNVKEKETS